MSSFTVKFSLPPRLTLNGESCSRDDFFGWVWNEIPGVQGVHEGTILSEQAAELGHETESFVVDAGLAPRERDWVGQSTDHVDAEIYFESRAQAESALLMIRYQSSIVDAIVHEVVDQDWMAKWKADYHGVDIPPYFKVVPPHLESTVTQDDRAAYDAVLIINPGAGFGTGTHETTHLCLEQIGKLSNHLDWSQVRALDFGSGSGILAIAMAAMGATVDAVEIDPLANENARHNAELSAVSAQIHIHEDLTGIIESYDVVVANILRPILIQFKNDLTSRLLKGSERPRTLILSGLVSQDIPMIQVHFRPLLQGFTERVFERGDWRAVVFSRV